MLHVNWMCGRHPATYFHHIKNIFVTFFFFLSSVRSAYNIFTHSLHVELILNVEDMRKRRKFYRGVVNHVYQRTIDGVQLFYTIEDCLVFYTIFSVCAKNAEIQVLMLCLMHNHIHVLVKTESVQELSGFMDKFSSWFVHEYNKNVGRKGKLLKKNFGSAPKWDNKKLRSAIIYIGNNPVEKGFCRKAGEARWNFMAYRTDQYPFSQKISRPNASYNMRRTLEEIDAMVRLNLPLKYAQIDRIFKKLVDSEKEQMIDYIISSYLPFDYDELESQFKSFDSMLYAMESTTGDDYDINESRDNFSLKVFEEMMSYMETKMPRNRIRTITAYTLGEKMALYKELQFYTSASSQQICSFLHIKTGEV